MGPFSYSYKLVEFYSNQIDFFFYMGIIYIFIQACAKFFHIFQINIIVIEILSFSLLFNTIFLIILFV